MTLAEILNPFNSKDPQVLPELGYVSPFNGISISGTPNLYCKIKVNLTLRVYKWNQTDPLEFVWFHLYTL